MTAPAGTHAAAARRSTRVPEVGQGLGRSGQNDRRLDPRDLRVGRGTGLLRERESIRNADRRVHRPADARRVVRARMPRPRTQCAGRTTPTKRGSRSTASVALVDDPAPPLSQPLTGTLLTPGWHGGARAGRRRRERRERHQEAEPCRGRDHALRPAAELRLLAHAAVPGEQARVGDARHVDAARRDARAQSGRDRCRGSGRRSRPRC